VRTIVDRPGIMMILNRTHSYLEASAAVLAYDLLWQNVWLIDNCASE